MGGILVPPLLPNTPLSSFKQIPYLGRIAKLSHTETGSVQVRMLIWKGALELQCGQDENHYLLWPGVSPNRLSSLLSPELAYHASRNTPVDRSHNETFDVLATTGMIGLGIYLFFMGSLFYFGLKGLGDLGTNRDRSFLLMMMTFGGIAGIFSPGGLRGLTDSQG